MGEEANNRQRLARERRWQSKRVGISNSCYHLILLYRTAAGQHTFKFNSGLMMIFSLSLSQRPTTDLDQILYQDYHSIYAYTP